MVASHCCVPQCTNGDRKNTDKSLSLYSFPKGIKQRKQWIAAVRRDEGKHFTINNNSTVVCSAHFKAEDIRKTLAGKRLLKKYSVPIFQWTDDTTKKRRSPSKRIRPSEEMDRASVTSEELVEDTSDPKSPPSQDFYAALPDHDYGIPQAMTVEEKLEEAINYIAEIETAKAKFDLKQFGVSRFSQDSDLIRFYTGFPSYKLFHCTFLALQPTASKMLRCSQVQRQRKDTSVTIREDTFRNENLSLIDQYFLFLCFIKQGFPELDLAVRFGVSQTTVSRIMLTWANYMYIILGLSPVWPS